MPASARSRAATLPEWEPPRTIFGAPISTCSPARREAVAASAVVGNSATVTPCSTASATWSSVASSWLARTMPRCAAHLGQRPAVVARKVAGARLTLRHQGVELRIRHAGLALVVGAIGLHAGELALAGRVVHQRDQPDPRLPGENRERLEDIRCTDLAAEVNEVVSPQPIARSGSRGSRRSSSSCRRRSGGNRRPCQAAARQGP